LTQQELSNRRVGLKRAIHYLRTKGYPFRAENHKILNKRFEELTGLKNPGLKFREWMGLLYSQGSEFLPKPPKEIRRKSKKNNPELARKKNRKTKSEDYQTYLLSSEWRLFRQKAFKHHGKVCKTCGSKEHLQVHHLHYKNIFHEQLEDVVILCETCHEAVHGRKFVYS